MLNLVNILKHCPKGTKLYSTIHGDCRLDKVDDPEVHSHPIIIETLNRYGNFTKEGKFFVGGNGECCLFPSKDQRDWSNFRLPCKRGDVMRTDNSIFIVKAFYKKDPLVYCYFNKFTGLKIVDKYGNQAFTADFYWPADEEEKNILMTALDNAGYLWNPTTCTIESLLKTNQTIDTNIEDYLTDKPQKVVKFNPFDKVLVSRKHSVWRPAFFWEEIEGGYYRAVDGQEYLRCIPYYGNEYLLGKPTE